MSPTNQTSINFTIAYDPEGAVKQSLPSIH